MNIIASAQDCQDNKRFDRVTGVNNNTEFIGKQVLIQVDRPKGSRHPNHGFLYPINYGFVPGTLSGDGEPLDAYILGVETPLETFSGICIAIIHRLEDDDDKLVIVPQDSSFSDEEIRTLTHFQEQWFVSEIQRVFT